MVTSKFTIKYWKSMRKVNDIDFLNKKTYQRKSQNFEKCFRNEQEAIFLTKPISCTKALKLVLLLPNLYFRNATLPFRIFLYFIDKFFYA